MKFAPTQMETALSTVGIRTSNSLQLGHVTSTARTDLGWRHVLWGLHSTVNRQLRWSAAFNNLGFRDRELQFGSAPFPI